MSKFEHQHMDFFMLFSEPERVVIEIDGATYAEEEMEI